jgi:voltage-gated sodium channel
MQSLFKRVAEANWFQNFITIVILFAGALVGVETYPEMVRQHGTVLHVLDQLVIWIFVAEVVVKMGAEGKKPWRYFLDPWNVFDFIIVAACFMPVGTQYVMVLRLARLLRVLKLVRALPKLQVLVGALLKSIPSMAYVSLLLSMLFYVYAVAATFMFSENDPIHFKTLPLSMLSLFRAVTLEDWTDLMYINMYGCANYGYDGNEALCTASEAYPIGSPLLFCTLILLGAMVILNLFIGVIMNGMEAARQENDRLEEIKRREERGEAPPSVGDELKVLEGQLDALKEQISRVRLLVDKQG